MKTFKSAKWAVTLILSVLLLPVYSAAEHKTVKEGESIASYNKKKEAFLRQVEERPVSAISQNRIRKFLFETRFSYSERRVRQTFETDCRS